MSEKEELVKQGQWCFLHNCPKDMCRAVHDGIAEKPAGRDEEAWKRFGEDNAIVELQNAGQEAPYDWRTYKHCYSVIRAERAKIIRIYDLHGKLEAIIHVSVKQIRYEMFSRYEKEVEQKLKEMK